jgi:hypothetical protein
LGQPPNGSPINSAQKSKIEQEVRKEGLGRVSVVEGYGVKTRQGFIPGFKKSNQDNYFIESNYAGIPNLWLMGVCDGHGAHGHLVSGFVKQHLPLILSDLINNKRDDLP